MDFSASLERKKNGLMWGKKKIFAREFLLRYYATYGEETRDYYNVPAGTFVPGEMENVPRDLAVRA